MAAFTHHICRTREKHEIENPWAPRHNSIDTRVWHAILASNMSDTPATRNTPLPAPSPAQREHLLTEQLKSVSRAFYLTLRVLPRDLRQPVGLAYLLARAADTIADTTILPPEKRLTLLKTFQQQLVGPASLQILESIAADVATQTKASKASIETSFLKAECSLLKSLPHAFSLLESLPENDRRLVRRVVTTLTEGMEFDLKTFPPEAAKKITPLETSSQLDNYTYLVAGCVGEFWTEITAAHTKSLVKWDIQRMSDLGVRFGKALQMTNILRDVSKDLRIGRCYIPTESLARHRLTPAQLTDTASSQKAKPILAEHLRLALAHYDAAAEYVLAISRRSWRLRLAALWPILIGLATLGLLAKNENWLSPEASSKVGRGWVYRMMALSLPAVGSDTVLRWWMSSLRRKVERAIV